MSSTKDFYSICGLHVHVLRVIRVKSTILSMAPSWWQLQLGTRQHLPKSTWAVSLNRLGLRFASPLCLYLSEHLVLSYSSIEINSCHWLFYLYIILSEKKKSFMNLWRSDELVHVQKHQNAERIKFFSEVLLLIICRTENIRSWIEILKYRPTTCY